MKQNAGVGDIDFVDFVSLSARIEGPRGARVQMGRRTRIDRHSLLVERLSLGQLVAHFAGSGGEADEADEHDPGGSPGW